LFIGWGLSHIVLLRGLETGKWYILFLCVIIWVGDAAAMYLGQSFGRHKLVPAISPGKTLEGALGGMLSALVIAMLTSKFLVPQLSLSQSLIFGLVVSLAAQLSDLGESILKRYTGAKDSGTLIPGHGGVLDRIDSLLFAAPVAFYTLELLTRVSSP
jgi:phosphatidate cytidylyltransferase